MKKYSQQLQVYSGIAILFVLLYHSTAFYLVNGLGLNTDYDRFRHMGYKVGIVRVIVYGVVPMFIFISGYKYQLNNEYENYKSFCLKKIKKVLPVFIIISIIFILYQSLFLFNLHGQQMVDVMLSQFLKIFIGYNFAYQLWYIPMYIFVTLSYPLIKKSIPNNVIRMIFFIILAVIIVIRRLVSPNALPYPYEFIYFFYLYELGIVACKYYEKINNKIIISFIVCYIILLNVSILTDSYLIYSLLKQVIVPFSAITFHWLSRYIKESKLFLYLGKYSFYIYLFHEPIFLNKTAKLLSKLNILNHSYSIIIMIVVPTILSILLFKVLSFGYRLTKLSKHNKQYNDVIS